MMRQCIYGNRKKIRPDIRLFAGDAGVVAASLTKTHMDIGWVCIKQFQ